MLRTSLACVVLLAGCVGALETSEVQSAHTGQSDSNDYSSWFQGISSSEIQDFEQQDDADQHQYPTEIPEPDHALAERLHAIITASVPALVAVHLSDLVDCRHASLL